ncbi:MAG: hypothetical protein QM820_09515 [Minicystis sp.]
MSGTHLAKDGPARSSRAEWNRGCLVVAAMLALANSLVAVAGVPKFLFRSPTPMQRVLVWVGLSLGPLSGWLEAFASRSVVAALPTVGIVTAVSCVPLVAAIRRRSVPLLALAGLLWFIAGYLFTIAMWA